MTVTGNLETLRMALIFGEISEKHMVSMVSKEGYNPLVNGITWDNSSQGC